MEHLNTVDLKQHILFVEDDPKIHKGISRLFQQHQVPWGYTFASGVDEALAIMDETDMDGVISDIKMPGRDGFDLLAYLRSSARWNDLPVVMLTGLDHPGLKNKALDLGATDLLNKPINPEELMARIRSVLHLKKCLDTIKSQNLYLEQLVCQRTEALEATRLDMIWRLARAAESRSEETGNHVIRVGYYSKILTEELGVPKAFSKMVFLTSPLHDLGKIGISDQILLKKGPLTSAEWDIMKTHCRIGQDLLLQDTHLRDPIHSTNGTLVQDILDQENNPFLQMAAEIAGSHHEQWQGNGYPFGITGEEIPLAARIVSVCDVYDALRSRRSYKSIMKHDDTLTIMRKENGVRFDPVVFDAFERCLSTFVDIHHQYNDTPSVSRLTSLK
ncbi:MAG: response regulator [Desulfobulbaceae bacterium]|nr:response regulator [Desulfobulbaceae bacterium]